MLYINHDDVEVRSLNLKGALVVDEQQSGKVLLDNLNIDNQGWEWRATEATDDAEEHQKIR